MRWVIFVCVALAACGNDSSQSCPTAQGPFAVGDPDGHAQPLGAGPNEARAGRVTAGDLPAVPSGLITWQPGDFVLANDRIALVIEDVGDSDLYDPWGGRPVGLARVEGGRMVAPNNFGEVFFLTGRSTVVTDSVSVIADGSDGGPAIIRARGKLHPLPFFEAIIAVVYPEAWLDIDAAIDYELAPGSEHVDVRFRYASPRGEPEKLPSIVHAFMYTSRTPVFQPGRGFDNSVQGAPYLALIDDAATSWAYIPGEGALGSSLSASGFVGAFSPGFEMPACGTLERLHAQLVIGGPGVDGLQAAVARTHGEAQRAITGTVTRDGQPVAGIHVHAIDRATDAYLTRATTDAAGAFTVHVPATADVRLDAVRVGEPIVAMPAGTGTGPVAIAMPALGAIHVTATEGARKVPVRIQVFPASGAPPEIPARYGEQPLPGGRQQVVFATTGDATLAIPAGSWDVVVSRGYEYELHRQTVTVTAGATVTVDALMDHAVATPGEQCGDFHIHTWRSNDSGDPALDKVAQAVCDGLELPVRSDHEYVADFSSEIAQLGLTDFAAGPGSIELTSFEVWGHMGVFPMTPDPTQINAGAPRWQTFPTPAAPDTPFATLTAPTVFDQVRARPEAPLVIINHPRGGANYFDYVGFDPATGTASLAAEFDTKFTLVEVFNDSDWTANRNRNVADWLGLLRAGRRVFAVGSSDSHGLVTSPVGYPRTCIALGTDDPRQATANLVRDQLGAGHAVVSGGIYVTARIGSAGPGDTTTGAGSPLDVDVLVQAATWIDVDAIDVVVDGETVDTIPIMPADRDPTNAAIRFHKPIRIQTAATGGFVVIAAYGDGALEPVHPGRKPFGVTNPIFVNP
ncbi:MAG TPA: CehA/McbA family metallohydrolase [Kofleriaceae bacterium]|nr:CehA/McbA family metallohydrolase [Kofleriaceae bacterium]